MNTKHRRLGRLHGLLLTIALLLAPLFGLALAQQAHAAGFAVTTLTDSGIGSLRQAILDTNVAAGADTITFRVSGTITLVSTLPAIDGELMIDGSGQSIIVSGNNTVQVMVVNPGRTLNLNGLTIANGLCSNCPGGGLYNNGGSVNVNHSTFSGNSAVCSPSCGIPGGAIMNGNGTLNVSNSTFSGNSSFTGGGIYNNGGSATVSNSTFSANSATLYGAGIYNDGGSTLTMTNSTVASSSAVSGSGIYNHGGSTLTMTNSTVSGNSATDRGAGIYNDDGSTLTMTNSTVSGNSATNKGGGISNDHNASLTVINSTISDNSSSIDIEIGEVTLQNTIIANSQGSHNCSISLGVLIDNGGNLSSDDSCFLSAASSRINTDPMLEPLAENGGPTRTHALLPGSPAIDAAIASCPETDQRGVARPQGAGCDSGAFEFEVAVEPTSTPTSTPTNTPTSTPTSTPIIAVDTSTSFTTSANPARLGEPITFRATVTSTSGEIPDGTVTFLNGTAVLGTGTLVDGVASFTTSSLPVGNSVLTTRYEGTPRFNASVSAPGTQVVRAGSSTMLTLSASTSTFGEPITLTATVSSGTASPSGSVIFYDGATALSTKALRSGTASLTINTLAAGSHSLTAVYGGSPELDGSVSPVMSHTVAPAQTTTTLTVVPSSSTLGQAVTLTANVSVVAPGGGKPAGTVSFYDGTTLLGTKTVPNNGVATYNTSTLAVGSHSLRAEYSGSANHSASASAPATLMVTPASTITTLATSATNVVNGQKVTLTASVGVVAPGQGTPTGSIIFRDGAIELGSVSLNNGRATKQVTLPVGSHSLVAEYVPADGSFGASSGTASVVVSPASTSVTLTTSGTPSTYGRKVTFTATVKVSAPGVGTPTGTVIFRDGDTVLAEVALINGKAIYATTALASGTHQITATYSGDVGNTGSVSSTLTQQMD